MRNKNFVEKLSVENCEFVFHDQDALVYKLQQQEEIARVNQEIEGLMRESQKIVSELESKIDLKEIELDQEENKENILIAQRMLQEIRVSSKMLQETISQQGMLKREKEACE